jgi:hypothetical protein
MAAALAAAPAHAQPAPADPIDALLRQRAIEEEPDVAATGSAAVEPDTATPATPQPYVPPRPTLTAPTYLHETGKAPDGPGTPTDAAYDARLRASASAVRAAYGPLEGGWTLTAGGQAAWSLQLIDRDGYVEGAWRDLRRPGALEGSGFIQDAPRSGGGVTLRFGDVVAVLQAGAAGWSGQVTQAGRSEPATLVRRGP